MRKTLIALLLSIVSVSYIVAGRTTESPRQKYNFNSDWKLHVGDAPGADKPDFDDRDWKSVTLPHAWNEDDAFQKDIKDLSTGIAWYRKHFLLPPGSEVKK